MESIKELNILTRKCYNTIARKYFDLFKNELNEKEFDRELLDNFALYFNKDSLVCDAGCGPIAHIGRYLFDKGLNVIGTDISDKCIEMAKANNPGMQFIRNDFFNWDFPENYFDGIISFYSIIYTPGKYIDELMRIFNKSLKSKGRLLMVVKEGASEGYINNVLDVDTNVYQTFFTEKEIENYLRNNGFRIKYLYTRDPLNSEINVKRIYAIGEKY
jgi:2-polyprenyl-3-methyl-5-hydroxy-6-metoxy-1,4-benzoquinol methylase